MSRSGFATFKDLVARDTRKAAIVYITSQLHEKNGRKSGHEKIGRTLGHLSPFHQS